MKYKYLLSLVIYCITSLKVKESVVIDIRDIQDRCLFSEYYELEAESLKEIKVKISQPSDNDYVTINVLRRNGDKKSSKIRVVYDKELGFIQTDKGVYTPRDKVKIRMIRLDNKLLPIKNEVRLQIENPQHVIVEQTNFSPKEMNSYIMDYEFSFPPLPIKGIWNCIMSFGQNWQIKKNVTFELKEYTLPTFSVNINSPKVILPSCKDVSGSVDARYVYGKPVTGLVTFKFGIYNPLRESLTLIGFFTEKLMENGHANYTFSIKEIKERYWFPELDGSHLYVEAKVRELYTNRLENGKDKSTKFSLTKYKISFRNTFIDMKPLRPTSFVAEILNFDDNHASNVPVKINYKDQIIETQSDEFGFLKINFIPSESDQSIKFEITTNDPNISVSEQGRASHTFYKHNSSIAYITIENKRNNYQIGQKFKSRIIFEGSTYLFSDVYYLIIVNSVVIKHGLVPESGYLEYEITDDMIPKARLVVITFSNEDILSDSLELNIKLKNCILNIQFETENTTFFKPGSSAILKITGVEDQEIAISAIDEAVELVGKSNILQNKHVMKSLLSKDTGCGPGGGKDPIDVILNAGLVIVGNKRNIGSFCKNLVKKRSKRTTNIYDSFDHKCCILGKKKDRFKRTCKSRLKILSKYISDERCLDAFKGCCLMVEETFFDLKFGGLMFATRTNIKKTVYFFDMLKEEEIFVRHDFRETWLFEIIIPNSSFYRYPVSLPHSITTWSINAFSLSPTQGLCILDNPIKVVVFKQVFIQVILPYSVVKNEQVEMLVVLFNYKADRITAMVDLIGIEEICSEAEPGERIRKFVTLEPHSSASIGFPLVPIKLGVFDIQIEVRSLSERDAVRKKVYVIPPGIPQEDYYSFYLDPSNRQLRRKRTIESQNFRDEIDVENKVQISEVVVVPQKKQSKVVPDSDECVVSAIADQYGPTVETALTNVEHLIRKPKGCGEQTIMYMAPTLFTLKYLNASHRLTHEKKNIALTQIKNGYKRELNFRKSDGSYSAFKNRPASLWLTAFIMKIFCSAKPYLGASLVKPVVNSGIDWLISKQRNDGSWIEIHPTVHKKIMGGVKGKLAMTAFVLSCIRECSLNDQSYIFNSNLTTSISLAEKFLIENKKTLISSNDSYKLALLLNSLTYSFNHSYYEDILEKLRLLAHYDRERNQMYWDTGNHEATAYVLLSLLRINSQNSQKPQAIANYLNYKRTFSGSFDSTQETIVALEALSNFFLAKFKPMNNHLKCNISSEGFYKTIEFQNDNSFVMQTFEITNHSRKIRFITEGDGIGIAAVKVKYHVLESPEKLCKFSINVTADEYVEDIKPQLEHVLGNDDDLFELFGDELMNDLGIEKGEKRKIREINMKNEYFNDKSFYEFVFPYDFEYNNSSHTSSIKKKYIDILMRKKRELSKDFELMFTLKICIQHIDPVRVDMGVIEAGLPTGYEAISEDLEMLVNNPTTKLTKYELNEKQIILYFDSFPYKNQMCLQFRIRRVNRVSNLQSAIVKVYDYYNEDESCTQMYAPTRLSDYLEINCTKDVCECARKYICPRNDKLFSLIHYAKDDMISARMKLKNIICDKRFNSAWFGRVLSIRDVHGTLWVHLQVERKLKGDNKLGSMRTVLLSTDCITKVNPRSGHRMLIIAKESKNESMMDQNSLFYDLDNEIGLEGDAVIYRLVDYFYNQLKPLDC